jgi:hypothetical protein
MPSPLEGALSPGAIQTLAALEDCLRVTQGPWWLIGGAAVALQGGDGEVLRDVDVIMDASDARLVLDALGAAPDQGGASAQFRSSVFGRWPGAPIPVDVMGDLEVLVGDRWTPVRPQTREALSVVGLTLHAPSRQELVAMLRLFGRPEDVARADRLSRIEG